MEKKLTGLPRRITSFLVAMVMVLSLLAGISTTSYASGEWTYSNVSDSIVATSTTNPNVKWWGRVSGTDTIDRNNPNSELNSFWDGWNWEGEGAEPGGGAPDSLPQPVISYKNSNYEEISGAPTEPGTYYVSATVGGVTNEKMITVTYEQDTVVTFRENITYNGTSKDLASVTPGHGTVYFRLGTEGDFSTEIPKATECGTYTVYYYIVGDQDYCSFRAPHDPYSVTVRITGSHINDVTTTFDGQTHYLDTSFLSADATVKYCETEDGTYTDEPIGAKLVSESKTVYYKIYVNGSNEPITGSADITIEPEELCPGFNQDRFECDGYWRHPEATISYEQFVEGYENVSINIDDSNPNNNIGSAPGTYTACYKLTGMTQVIIRLEKAMNQSNTLS